MQTVLTVTDQANIAVKDETYSNALYPHEKDSKITVN